MLMGMNLAIAESERDQKFGCANGDDQSGDATEDGKQNAFGQRLNNDLATRAPTASRTAVWVRRATARASSKLATLAHAISKTSPQTARSICRLRPYSSFMTATPAPAGTTLMICFGSRRTTSAANSRDSRRRFASTGEGCAVRRGPMPSMDAPGFRRPITRSHAEDGWRRPAHVRRRSKVLLQGNPDVGGIATEGLAEEAGRSDADDGERMAFDDEASEPTTDLSAP